MPVVGKTAEDIAARAETFRSLAATQLEQPDFAKLNICFLSETGDLLAEAYFALSEAYKRERIPAGHNTEWSKAAALVAATVSVINPLRPAGRYDDPNWLYVNPQFAMLCAYGHSQSIFASRPFDERRRFFQSLQNLRLPCLDPIISEANINGGKFHSFWSIHLTPGEIAMLDVLVSSFVLLMDNAKLQKNP